MSLHDPIARKRVLDSEPVGLKKSKKIRDEVTTQPSGETSIEGDDFDKHSTVFSEQMYSAYVKSALLSLEKNEPLQINSLTDKIRLPLGNPDAINLRHFSIVLKCLISNVSRLDNKACHNLIFAILGYKWLDIKKQDHDSNSYITFIDLYSHFLTVLVSTLPKYLSEVTTKIIGEFDSFNHTEQTIINHHDILGKIFRYIPTCINTIPQTLQKNFPHHLSSSTSELTNYVNNLLHIISYCPELQFGIWQLIIECCIKLDVELQNELDDLDDDEIEELINGDDDEDSGLVVISGEDKNVSDSEDEEENEDEDEDEEGGQMDGEVEYMVDPINSPDSIKVLVSKLDNIMNELFLNTEISFTEDELNNGNGVNLFNTITSLFKSHILPTHFTKSIQFVLFHITQYHPELSDSYLVLLIDVAFNPKEILEKRLKAIQYLSSYIARAKQLSRHQIVFVVSYLIGWLDKYIMERECEIADLESTNNKQVGGMERFKLFYATFQALLYIFCFRHDILFKNGEANPQTNSTKKPSSTDSEWECDLDKFFQRAIIAKFNPLKFCDETVVYIFAKLATKLNVCYCYSIIEHNKRQRMLSNNGVTNLPSAVGNFKQKQEFLDLEAYFPFDPMVLPMSKKIINKNYVEWSEVNPEDEDDEDSASGSHLEEDDEESEESDDEEEN
ncbi:RNA polymerase I-specific transcription initiation factor RRN3 [Spathaspora sp. JA1]|nr:RNA polymerase I-specific transcription initiation factor RRN3 [Spathaspora sp. JA1]